MPKKSYYYQTFKECYSTDFSFIKKSSKGGSYAYCIICNADFSIAHGGRNDITAHASRDKHKSNYSAMENSRKLDSFFCAKEGKENAVINAECLFTAFLLEHNLPLSCADHAGPLFRKMFPDSKIAKEYGCARTKTSAIIGEISSDKQSSMCDTLKNTVFSVAVDGSNDSDSKLYPIVVTFFNLQSSQIECSLLSLSALVGDSTGVNIGNLVLDKLKSLKIPIENCIALGCDNANVMTGEKAGVISVLKKANSNIFCFGCICHLLNLAAQKGSASMPVQVDDILIDIYYYFQKSVKRKDRFKELQIMYDYDVRKILKHVCTRWLSVGRCLTRMLDQWKPLLTFFKEECNKSKESSLSLYKIPKKQKTGDNSQNPSRSDVKKSMESKPNKKRKADTSDTITKESQRSFLTREQRVFYFLPSDVNKAYCLFLLNMVKLFEKVNTFFQNQSPQIHVARDSLITLFKDILVKFVKPSTFLLSSESDILKIDYHNSVNQKDDKDLVVGSAASDIIAGLPDSERRCFFSAVRKYFCTVCDYMRLKFPFDNDILIRAKVATLSKISDSSFCDIKFFVEKFPIMLGKTEVTSLDIDELQEEFCALQIETHLIQSMSDDSIDEQWYKIGQIKDALGHRKFEKLSKVMLAILVFPHSNTECERVFSQVRKTRTEFRASMTDNMLEKLLLAKNTRIKCFDTSFDQNFLKRAKSSTYNSLK